jgi:hypothetical protein
MLRIILIIIPLFLLYSCAEEKDDTIESDNTIIWKKFKANGIPEIHDSYDAIIFQNKNVGYLGGSESATSKKSDISTRIKQNAVLYKTINQGQSWSKLNLDKEGNIEEIYTFGDSLIILNQSLFTTPYIAISTNNASNWRELYKFNKETYIRALNFINSNEAYVVIDKKNKKQVLKLTVNSRKLDTLYSLPNDSDRIIFTKKYIYSLVRGEKAYSKGILIVDIETGKSKELLFDDQYYVESLSFNKEQELFLTLDGVNNKSKILTLSNGQFKELNIGLLSDYSLGEVFVYEKHILVIANQRDNIGMSGVNHEIILSKDGGATWSVNKMPFSYYTKPRVLFQNEFFMTYGGMAMFQKLLLN